MKKSLPSIILLLILLLGCQSTPEQKNSVEPTESQLTPGAVVAASQPDEWLLIDQDDLLYMTVDGELVIMALMPALAPRHVENTKSLVRQGIFDDTRFYRVLDGFVAQGGPLYESEEAMPALASGSFNIPAEFTREIDMGDAFALLDEKDGYADQTGFYRGFAVGRADSDEAWLLHCYGALAMGRANDVNTGGIALYIVNGPAQRYLDRNTTVFGRVLVGMEHIQGLQRTADLSGPVELKEGNQIQRVQVGRDVPADAQWSLEVMDSASDSFQKLMAARQNRSGEWFVFQHDHMDACGMPIPVRKRQATE